MRQKSFETHPAIEAVTAETRQWHIDISQDTGMPYLQRISREKDGSYVSRTMQGTADVAYLGGIDSLPAIELSREDAWELRREHDQQLAFRPHVQPALRSLFRAGYLQEEKGGILECRATSLSFNREFEVARTLHVQPNGQLSIRYEHPYVDYEGRPASWRRYVLPHNTNHAFHDIKWSDEPIIERHDAVNPHLIIGVFKNQFKELVKIVQKDHVEQHDEVLPVALSA